MKKIYGRKPVLEALEAGEEIEQVFIVKGQQGGAINKINGIARKNKIKVSFVPPQKIESLVRGQNTQGVVALTAETTYVSMDDILEKVRGNQRPLLLILDSIQDTHNLGAILRSAEGAGVDGVIMGIHQAAPLNDIAVKTSAGAVSHLDICKEHNLNNAISTLKEAGFWITGTALGGNKLYTDVDYNAPTAIVMGNEEKGIRPLIAKNCDNLVEIPMMGKIQSLNVSVAAGILLFEVMRQRGFREK